MRSGVTIFFLLLLSTIGEAQISYKESGDTLILNSIKISPGDTIHLGIGSSPTKDFLFLWQVPTKKNISLINGSTHPKYLSKMFSNGFLIYHGKVDEGNKKLPLPTPVFFLSGDKNFEYNIDLVSAIKTQEIIL